MQNHAQCTCGITQTQSSQVHGAAHAHEALCRVPGLWSQKVACRRQSCGLLVFASKATHAWNTWRWCLSVVSAHMHFLHAWGTRCVSAHLICRLKPVGSGGEGTVRHSAQCASSSNGSPRHACRRWTRTCAVCSNKTECCQGRVRRRVRWLCVFRYRRTRQRAA